jgi:hypothetical protein
VWTKEKRAQQSAIAKQAWAKKVRFAPSITDEQYDDALTSISIKLFFEKDVPKLVRMRPARFAALAREAEVDESLIAAVHAKMCEDFGE